MKIKGMRDGKRKCIKCKRFKEISEFYKSSTGACKECHKKRTGKYYKENKEKVLQGKREKYREVHAGQFNIVNVVNEILEKRGENWLGWIKEEHKKKWGDWHEKYCGEKS